MIDECKRNARRLRERNKNLLLVLGRVVCVSEAEELSRRTDNSCLFYQKGSAPLEPRDGGLRKFFYPRHISPLPRKGCYAAHTFLGRGNMRRFTIAAPLWNPRRYCVLKSRLADRKTALTPFATVYAAQKSILIYKYVPRIRLFYGVKHL